MYVLPKLTVISENINSMITSNNHLLQGIDLLATTPSDLAMSLKTETINVEVKNRMVTERITVARDREQISEYKS